MAADSIHFKKYQEKKLKEINYLNKGMDILYTLVNYGFDSYIIGAAVCDLYLCLPITSVEIYTKATYDELKQIYPAAYFDKENIFTLSDSLGLFTFLSYEDPKVKNVPSDLDGIHYNTKLIEGLATKNFTMYQLALTPNKEIVDVFGGIDDIDNEKINVVDSLRKCFNENPETILDALDKASIYGFKFERKTLRMMMKTCLGLKNINLKDIVEFVRKIIANKFGRETLITISKNELFKAIPELDVFCEKLIPNYNLDETERLTLLYLIIGSIPDAARLSDLLLKDVTETITITQLIMTSEVTPMMVYNIGVDKLLSSDRIAQIYKKQYKSQAKLIRKLKHNIVITSPRELNFTELELIQALKGERSIRVHIIMNLLLEKVINKEINNYPKVLKEEALKIDKEIRSIFEYQEVEENKHYSEAEIEDLLNKYNKELSFIVKIYLNDEKELYSLSPSERLDAEENAKEAAKAFLLETSQYKVLEERRLI